MSIVVNPSTSHKLSLPNKRCIMNGIVFKDLADFSANIVQQMEVLFSIHLFQQLSPNFPYPEIIPDESTSMRYGFNLIFLKFFNPNCSDNWHILNKNRLFVTTY